MTHFCYPICKMMMHRKQFLKYSESLYLTRIELLIHHLILIETLRSIINIVVILKNSFFTITNSFWFDFTESYVFFCLILQPKS